MRIAERLIDEALGLREAASPVFSGGLPVHAQFNSVRNAQELYTAIRVLLDKLGLSKPGAVRIANMAVIGRPDIEVAVPTVLCALPQEVYRRAPREAKEEWREYRKAFAKRFETSASMPVGEALGQKARRLDPGLRRKLNDRISDIAQGYQRSIPLDAIADLLRQYGLVLLQEDGTEYSGILTGRDGTALIRIGWLDSAYDQHTIQAYEPIPNSALSLSWHKMETGTWETVAYLS